MLSERERNYLNTLDFKERVLAKLDTISIYSINSHFVYIGAARLDLDQVLAKIFAARDADIRYALPLDELEPENF